MQSCGMSLCHYTSIQPITCGQRCSATVQVYLIELVNKPQASGTNSLAVSVARFCLQRLTQSPAVATAQT